MSLPLSLGKLAKLTRLDINDNQFKEVPECIFQLKQLQELYLHHNPLGSLPVQLFSLQSLTGLNVSNTQLSVLPGEIGNLTNLTWLYIRGNMLEVLPSSLCQLAKLETLLVTVVVSSNLTLANLLGQLPKSLQNLYLCNMFDNIEYQKPRTEQETNQFQQQCNQRGIKLTWK